jgi:hypothetical protein
MDKIDRLLMKALPRLNITKRLEEDNPYFGKPCSELLGLLDRENYQAPEMKTPEWDQFMYAIVHASGEGGLTE